MPFYCVIRASFRQKPPALSEREKRIDAPSLVSCDDATGGIIVTVYRQTILDNGIRVITESIPYVRSVAIGFWYLAGSRNETPEQNGISHLIEHLMFKGTTRWTARQIAEIVDASGGQLNAYTSKDHTCYYARVLDEHVGLAVEILADMLRHSLFAPAEMEKEKGVVLEEIKLYEDSPDELVHDLIAEAIFDNHPLGLGVLGQVETVQPIQREDVLAYLDRFYTGERLVVAAAGNLDHANVVAEVERHFATLARGREVQAHVPVPDRGAHRIKEKETEQVHLCVGVPALARHHPQTYTMHLLDVIMGGGMSSRLFQELREERGLVYSTYTYHSTFDEGGLFCVYAGCSPSNGDEVLALIGDALLDAAERGFKPDEVLRAKEQLKGSLMIGLENTANRMSRLARCVLFDEELLTPDQLIQRIDAVKADELQALAQDLFGGPLYLAAIGPVDSDIAGLLPGGATEVCEPQ